MLAFIHLSLLASSIFLLGLGSSQSFQTSTIPKPLNTAELNLPKSSPPAFGEQNVTRTSIALPPRITGLVNIASGCAGFNFAVDRCMEETASFTTYAASNQASCLCYHTYTTAGVPIYEAFDNSISYCATHLSTASPAQYSTFTRFNDFCSIIDPPITGSPTSSVQTSGGNTASSTRYLTSSTNGSPGNSTDTPKDSVINMKVKQIIGITVGCSGAGLLAAYAVWARYRKKRLVGNKQRVETHEVKMSGEPKVGEEVAVDSSSKELAKVDGASKLQP